MIHAQTLAPSERITFQEAIQRAVNRNPSSATAAAGIVRAAGLVRQARAATALLVTANVTTTTVNRSVEFDGTVVAPRNQVTALMTADLPIVAAAARARRTQAEDNVTVAELNAVEVRRQIAFSTADAFLAVIAQRRVVEANVRARDVAKAHFDLANELEQRGSGSHVNTLRAQQQWSNDERLVEAARLALYRAQEALAVLIVADGPVDAADEPAFEIPPDAATVTSVIAGAGPARAADEPGRQPALSLLQSRPDLKLFAAAQAAAERVVRDTSREYLPSLDALFVPQTTYPSPFFVPANSWRLMFQANVPIIDSGQRASLKVQRQAALDQARATLAGAVTRATSEVRAAREAVASGERGLGNARAAAEQALQVVSIINISFRAGAATSIEVIDADRSARDAETAVAVAEDTLRRARLELLTALGRFP